MPLVNGWKLTKSNPDTERLHLNKILQEIGTAVTTADKTYYHVQGVAASTWVVDHNLNKYPSVNIIDSSGNDVVGDITYTSLNSVTLTFSAAFAGTATFN